MGGGELRSWSRPLPSPAWPPRLGHSFGTDVPEHIPGTGQYRRLKGFSLLLPFPLPLLSLPTPALLLFLLAARPKHRIHEFRSWGQMAGAGSRGAGTHSCQGPSRPGERDTSNQAAERTLLGTTELCLSPMGQKGHSWGSGELFKVLAPREPGCDSVPLGMGQGVARDAIMSHSSIALVRVHLLSNPQGWKSYLFLPLERWRCRQVKGFGPRSHNISNGAR